MSWPLSQDYNEAIQNPSVAFGDADLRQGEAATNAMGMPMPRSGNFADVYEFTTQSGKRLALKCFTRDVPGLQERYAEISKHLKQAKLPFIVEFTYYPKGLKVAGQFYPFLKMDWVQGLLLNEFVRDNADKPNILKALSQVWIRMAQRLREANLAHGDLQHGNVILIPAAKASSLSVRLIDYDGMIVPALTAKKSGELGHPAYQHPERLREGIYRVEVDRFPLLAIYTALKAVGVGGKALWQRYDNGDNLLFREVDFRAPESSAVLKELWQMEDPTVHHLVGQLVLSLTRPLREGLVLDQAVANPVLLMLTSAQEEKVTSILGPGATLHGVEVSEVQNAIMVAQEIYDTPLIVSPLDSRNSSRSVRSPQKSKRMLLAAIGSVAGIVLLGIILLLTRESETPPAPSGEGAARLVPVSKKGKEKVADTPVIPVVPDAKAKEVVEGKTEGSDKEPLTLHGHGGVILSLALSSDGKRLVSGSLDKTIKVWDAVTGKEVFTLYGITGSVNCLALSPDGNRLYSAISVSTIKVWDLETGKATRTLLGHKLTVGSLALSSDGKRLVSGSLDKTIKVWDLVTGKETLTLHGHTSSVSSLALSPDGNRLYSGSGSTDKTIKAWDLTEGKEAFTLHGHTGAISSLALSSDGKRLFSGSLDKTIKEWDLEAGKETRTLLGHTSGVGSITLSADGKRLYSGSLDKTIKAWDLEAGKETRTLLGHAGNVRSLALSSDGKRLYSGSLDKTIKAWDLDIEKATLVERDPVDTPDRSKSLEVGTGAEIKGEITAGDPRVGFGGSAMPAKEFSVKLESGQRYLIRLDKAGGGLDPYLILQDKDGRHLASDDDGGGNLNSLLSYSPPGTGTYKIFAAALNGQGTFSLMITPVTAGKEDEFPPPELAYVGKEEFVVKVKDKTGEIKDTDHVRYKFAVLNKDKYLQSDPTFPLGHRFAIKIIEPPGRVLMWFSASSPPSWNSLWFSLPKTFPTPDQVYVEVEDKKFGRRFNSSLVKVEEPVAKVKKEDPPMVSVGPDHMPRPALAFVGKEVSKVSGVTRYNLAVTNASDYSDELFRPSPELPAVALNKKASRTLVKIFDDKGSILFGSNEFDSAEELKSLSFLIKKGAASPSEVFVELHDRKLDRKMRSNLTYPGTPSAVLNKETTVSMLSPSSKQVILGNTVALRYRIVSKDKTPDPIPKAKTTRLGYVQLWVEYMDKDGLLPGISQAVRKGNLYPHGKKSLTSVNATDLTRQTLFDTTGYLPGRYRCYLEVTTQAGALIDIDQVEIELK